MRATLIQEDISAWIAKLRAGDPEGEAWLAGLVRATFARWLSRERDRRRLDRLEETDDLVQDVCIKVLRRVRTRPESVRGSRAEVRRLVAWSAREVLREKGPAHRVRVRSETTERLDLHPAGDTSVASIADRRDRAARLKSALGLLDGEERLAIETVFLRGLSYRQAAEGLGWGLGRLRGRVESAFARMRPALAMLNHDS